MTAPGIILYGPPASGKDTITRHLIRLHPVFELLRKVKLGSGSTDGYRMISTCGLSRLRDQRKIVSESFRYGNTYAVDRTAIEELCRRGQVPIVHENDATAIAALQRLDFIRWVVVLLLCPRDETERRLKDRHCSNIGERLDAWDNAQRSFNTKPLIELRFDLCIRTDFLTSQVAARAIGDVVQQSHPELDSMADAGRVEMGLV